MAYEDPDRADIEGRFEDKEAVERYSFRYRIKSILAILDDPTTTLPNKNRVRELLNNCLLLVPPFSKQEEEWLDHNLEIERGEVLGGQEGPR
jgi:hypothetical protein